MLKNQKGQGLVEYVMLIALVAIIIVVAVMAFQGGLTTLWNNITATIGGW
jgi:pilus assembly protein Flp/PilA